MVKKVNINVSYNNQSKIISCERQEIAHEIASRFGININDVIMYTVNKEGGKVQVSPNDINGVMKILLVPKRNGEQTLHTYLEVDSPSKKIVDGIISKLRLNTTLNGQERKLLIDALETHSTEFFKKRKLEDKQPRANKKVQVNISATNIKESFAQTDPLNIVETHANNEEDTILKLKRLWNMEDKPFEEIEILMRETYNERRHYIYFKCPPVSVVKELYPALFCTEQVKSEVDRIFYPGKCEEFLSNMTKYYKYILHYGEDEDISERTKKAIEYARTPLQKTYAGVVGSIFVLAKLLEENFGFIHLSDYPHGRDDLYPHIDASCHSLKKIFFDGVLFHIIVEGKQLCEASNFPEAILCLMASFFIFNIHYPENCRRTLTVLEKLYLKANDTTDMDDTTVQMIKLFELWVKECQVRN